MIAIAIDGPAGAGKSTISRRLARQLQFIYVDTGALYRAVALKFLENSVSLDDAGAVADTLAQTVVDLEYVEGEQRALLDGRDVGGLIRTPEISMMASDASALPAVRAFLLDLQRALARRHNVIMDGRDIGTVVLPDAQLKIFLTASSEDRARRRYEELLAGGESAEYGQVLREVRQRDYNDSHRAVAPLKPAPDAVLIDTTGNSLETSIALLRDTVKERLGL